MPTSSLIHEAGPDDAWQESKAIYWCDREARVGGVVAFGGWPNRERIITWYGIVAPDHGLLFQRTRRPSPLLPEDRAADRIGGAGVHYERAADGVLRLRAHDAETGTLLELVLDDFYEPAPYPQAGAAALESNAAGHLEATGRGEGRLVIDGREIPLRPDYHRDTSWGPRVTQPVSAYSWSVGSCGPDLSWTALVLNIEGLPPLHTAFAARRGVLVPARDVHTLVTVDHDALTVRRWCTTLTLADDTTITIESDSILGHLLDHREWPDVVATDTIGSVRVNVDGETADGWGALNRITNPRLGSAVPSRYLGGTVEEGLTRLAP